MAFVDREGGSAVEPPKRNVRARPRVRVLSEFEAEIRQLYLRMMDDPVPPHLLRIVRAALASKV